MSNYELIKQLIKGTGIYKRQLLFFAIVFLFFASILGFRNYQHYLSADPMGTDTQKTDSEAVNLSLNITNDGRIFKDGRVVSTAELGDKYDEIRYNIIDKPGVYIDKLRIVAHFQFNIDRSDISYRVIAAHTDNGFKDTTQANLLDNRTISYTGYYLGPNSTFTIYARLPKGIITPPWWRTSAFDLTNLSLKAWIVIGLVLPLATFITLVTMIYLRWSYIRLDPNLIITEPPDDLPPALVGVLMNGRIGPREVASTLIDLAQKDYLYIFQGSQNFNFGRGQALESNQIYELKRFEKLLLSKIFSDKNATNNLKNISEQMDQGLFSPKMGQIFLDIYNQASDLGYFQQNPSVTHQKYKIAGMVLFFVSTLGFILNTLLNKTFPFLIFFWIGMMISSALIVYFSPRMPVLTPKGRSVRQAWLAFKNYLAKTETINFKETQQSPYSKYLAYAIALSVEVNWTKHFYDIPFIRPKWFDSNPTTQTIEDFANTLFPLVAFVGQNLISTRPPVVD